MYNRFQKKQNRGGGYRTAAFSLAVFLAAGICVYGGVRSVSDSTDRRQKESLEQAIHRDMVTCYALEGAYPESVAYMQEHYGLTYDEDRYLISYEVIGSNLMPDVTVLEKKEG